MENKRKRKKILIAKILTVTSLLLFITLFSIVIWQTVKINNLNNDINKINEEYQSETEVKEWTEQLLL